MAWWYNLNLVGKNEKRWRQRWFIYEGFLPIRNQIMYNQERKKLNESKCRMATKLCTKQLSSHCLKHPIIFVNLYLAWDQYEEFFWSTKDEMEAYFNAALKFLCIGSTVYVYLYLGTMNLFVMCMVFQERVASCIYE